MNSELRMRRGISGAFAKTEAQWGKGLTRLQIVLGVVIGAIAIAGFIGILWMILLGPGPKPWDENDGNLPVP
ncbi:hypothetical protein, partial [Rhodococcus zopfii]